MTELLATLPPVLREKSARYLHGLRAVPDPIVEELPRLFAMSDFVAQSCTRYSDLLPELVKTNDLLVSYGADWYAVRLTTLLDGCANEDDLQARLRRFRRREMVRIAWRDLSGRAEFEETATDLSNLADACLDGALRVIEEWHQAQFGIPYGADGAPLHLVVLGMGKLGGVELNYSSDVDLIFCYREEGETREGPRSLSHQEFFIRLGQRLIAAIDRVTADGFVFRVDMRLRPFGEAGALAISFDAMEEYYQVHGREWERYAMVKARAVAGDRVAGEQLLNGLKPFVYRRYVDFGAFESLREMKGMIETETRRKGMGENIKLGRGGIREVEFIVQAFQLVRGGREPHLQERSLLPTLRALGDLGLLPDYAVQELITGYLFLRNTENAIQMAADEQKQELPFDDEGQARLALAMGYGDWAAFAAALDAQRGLIHRHFEQVFAAPQREAVTDSGEVGLGALWQGLLLPEAALALLASIGYQDPAEALRLIDQTRGARVFRALSPRGRQRLDGLMPLLLGAVGGRPEPDLTLKHVIRLVEAIAKRTAYLALLVENPMALSQLVRLCSASPWIAALLALHPVLLDELLDPRSLYHPPQRAELGAELRRRLARLNPEDEEQHLETLRHFKQSNTLRVAAADVAGVIPLIVVSDHLTDIAELTLQESLDLAWHHLVARHGRPGGIEGKGFAVIAYGKLGGVELGYGSDLDLVFLHGNEMGTTDGARPLENAVFYARLAQRLIHILSTRTPSGVLYEVDTRLRPNGASGLLVSTVEAFAEYQRHQAWTWEHQALVRARMVAGDSAIGLVFERVRREVLGRERDHTALRREVREMRERMQSNLSKATLGQFDLKQDPGGIADIEFMVQYGVLAWAHAFPELLDFTDNIRQLEGLARNGIINQADAELLGDAYRAYRARLHRLTLKELPAVVAGEEFARLRAGVQALWQRTMETN